MAEIAEIEFDKMFELLLFRSTSFKITELLFFRLSLKRPKMLRAIKIRLRMLIWARINV